MAAFSCRSVAFGVAIAMAFMARGPLASAQPVGDAERSRLEGVVHDYLMKHPEVIIQAVEAYQEAQQAAKDKLAKDEIGKHANDLLHDPDTQVMGNTSSDCTIVEFFDNQCPYCQANEPELQKLLKQDGRVKLVLKEFPILGPVSVTAAKAALASVKQGKYAAFHEALLAHHGHYDKAAVVDDIARSVGLDMDKLHKDMDSPEIAKEIDNNLDLGRSLDITGTPGFVIGGEIVSGASSVDELKKYVADECKG